MNAIFLPLALAFAQASGPAAPPDDYVKSWDAVEKAISTRYYARKSKKEKMDKLLAKYAPLAKAAKTRQEFSDDVNKMIDEFGDSHFDFFTPADQQYYLMDALAGGKEQMPQFGAWFRRTTDGYTVQMVTEESAAAKAGLMKGDVVTLIDGKPFSPIDAVKEDAGKTAKITFRHNGRTIEKEVDVRETAPLDMFLDGTRDSARIIEQSSKKIGYLHLWTMADTKSRDTLQGLMAGKFKDTDAMILDIRDGFGGRPEGYGDPFFRPGVVLEWKFGEVVSKQPFGYDKPLVVLINGGSRSAKEVFSYIMKKSKRATLIGSNTAGHVLGTTPGRLNDWSIIEIPIVEVFADGQVLEGKGVAPDIAVKQEFSETGEDLYIKEALRFLGGATRK